MDSYLAAKALLFEQHLSHGGTAVLNVSDTHWQDFAKAAAKPHGHMIGYGRPSDAKAFFSVAGKKNPSARYLAIAQRTTHASGVRGVWTLSSERNRISEVPFSLPLLGDFQHENAAAAAASLVALGYPLQQIASALQSTRLIPGRLEPVRLLSDNASAQVKVPSVVVDYAHTPDALEKTLQTCRALLEPGGRLLCVFGCGGDRDVGKRPLMGEIAATLADACYVTSDNPRTEDPQRILSDIVAGVPDSHKVKISVDAERSRAIAKAVADAGPDDLVVVAGKGHEDYQIMGTEKLPFSDVEEARKALESRATR
jgi:UDP-N-acetylmuramoyl-L-alanyl-D-glutamate--2,6-diaminopimelate ligase